MDRERAWSYVLAILTRRSHTEAEIVERLGRKQAPQHVVDDVMARLRRYRLVDDEAFAEAYVRTHGHRKGSIALRSELMRKGVPEDVTEGSLKPLDDASQIETATGLLERNAWRFQGPDRRRERARAFAFLARRGFPGEVVSAALERSPWLDDDDTGH